LTWRCTSPKAPLDLHQRVLFTEHYVLAGRVGHPGLKRKPTREQFCALEHVMVSREGGGFFGVTDKALAEVGWRAKWCCRCRIF
jgi:DNA-binding transcriptional LysR family regulator